MSEGGYALIMEPCFACKQPFTFNPHKVPSFSPTGRPEDRRAICAHCIEIVNAKRIANGLEPWPVAPDAYDAIPEGEL